MAKFYYRLRSGLIQKLVWRRLGGLVEWVMQTFMIGWAGRERQFLTGDKRR